MFGYLPSELNNLRLESLNVFPNRYFVNPPKPGQAVSEPKLSYAVPSLVELAFRVLGSPPPPEMQAKYASMTAQSSPPLRNVLEYYLPMEMDTLGAFSGPLRRVLDACSPGWIPQSMLDEAKEGEDESMQVMSIARCGNPEHESGFLRHAEERYTWVNVVAGKLVGGMVPLRWRGCSRGCLSLLDAVADDGGRNKEDEFQFEPVTFGAFQDED
ncbi:hypothetical protein FA13DRAFT_176418 [Coprinellus micaceus]|uniref:Uncharacterized protein n=1 Tax=Coprinellus micaceus TaxID=71717 RepID=A0A4Y7TFP7_COPMI|nr:hypothetical protein FA13DRAFT_176418 [Coprinellus micaceus]